MNVSYDILRMKRTSQPRCYLTSRKSFHLQLNSTFEQFFRFQINATTSGSRLWDMLFNKARPRSRRSRDGYTTMSYTTALVVSEITANDDSCES